jgi:hypothetical protein
MKLMRYDDSSEIRNAYENEIVASLAAARTDGGAGVIDVDGVSCYVVGDLPAVEIVAEPKGANGSGAARISPEEYGAAGASEIQAALALALDNGTTADDIGLSHYNDETETLYFNLASLF